MSINSMQPDVTTILELIEQRRAVEFELSQVREQLADVTKDRDYYKKLADTCLAKTADEKFVVECTDLFCPKCRQNVRQEIDLCFCDACPNPDSPGHYDAGLWYPSYDPLPLCYESCFSTPEDKSDVQDSESVPSVDFLGNPVAPDAQSGNAGADSERPDAKDGPEPTSD